MSQSKILAGPGSHSLLSDRHTDEQTIPHISHISHMGYVEKNLSHPLLSDRQTDEETWHGMTWHYQLKDNKNDKKTNR